MLLSGSKGNRTSGTGKGLAPFADTLNAIDEALSQLGVEKIGIIDQKVRYNASLHSSSTQSFPTVKRQLSADMDGKLR